MIYALFFNMYSCQLDCSYTGSYTVVMTKLKTQNMVHAIWGLLLESFWSSKNILQHIKIPACCRISLSSLGGGSIFFKVSALLGEMIQIDEHIF